LTNAARQYYDYNEFLCELLSNLFSPTDFVAFLNSNETPRPVVIRANTLRTHRRELKQALVNIFVNLEKDLDCGVSVSCV